MRCPAILPLAIAFAGAAVSLVVMECVRLRLMGVPAEASRPRIAVGSSKSSADSQCHRPHAFPQSASMPWRLYDAFVSRQDGCAVATFIAQYERGCEEMEKVLEGVGHDAGFDNVSAWFGAAKAKQGDCATCVLSDWEYKYKPAFSAARRRSVQEAGGPTTQLVCVFDDGTRVSAKRIDHRFHKGGSTLVWECDVPEQSRWLACQNAFGVSAIEDGNRSHSSVRLCVFDSNITNRVDVAACTWTSATSYLDRDGNRKRATSVVALRDWLAAHVAFGVDYFLIFDDNTDWADPSESALWPAVGPLVEHGRAKLLPWPWRACGARGDGPWISLNGSQRTALSVQSFWGRPAQYASQNACHRRLRPIATWVAHLDVDEFAVPARRDSILAAIRSIAQRRPDLASLALPHLFYGACPGEHDDGRVFSKFCAGKQQPSRNKQIARSDAVDCVMDHVAKIHRGKVVTADAALDARLVHTRDGYAFTGPAAARFATVRREHDVTPKQRDNYNNNILPRLRSLNCDDIPADLICENAPNKVGLRPHSNSTSPAARSKSFCWCQDITFRDYWYPRIQAARSKFWQVYENGQRRNNSLESRIQLSSSFLSSCSV